jgi:hypothetical protein
VDADSGKGSVVLYWYAPGYSFENIHVCYKKNWEPVGKCDGGKDAYRNYGLPVSQGNIAISGLEKDQCYKFAVYGVEPVEILIGQKKIKTK